MTTERYVNADGVVIESEVLPDVFREVVVAQVVDLAPPTVQLSSGRRIRVHARTVGLTVQLLDRVLVCRVEQGVVAISKVEVI